MIPNQPKIIPMPWAQNGDRSVIPEEVSTSGAANASWNDGFPPITRVSKNAGGKPPLGIDFQSIFYTISGHLFWLQSGNVYSWSNKLNYLAGAHVLGSDGQEYRAKAPSGPEIPGTSGYVGAIDPVADTQQTYWQVDAAGAIDVFHGATEQAAGTSGLVPAPNAGQVSLFLRSDGTWAEAIRYLEGTGIKIAGGVISLATVTGLTAGTFGQAQSGTVGDGQSFKTLKISVDDYGRITAVEEKTITISAGGGGSGSNVMAQPSVAHNSHIVPGETFTATFGSESYLVDGAILKFTGTFAGVSFGDVSASDGAGSVQLTMPLDATGAVELSVRAHDSYGNVSSPTVVTIVPSSGGAYVATPTLTLSTNSLSAGENLTLLGSPFSTPGSTSGVHDKTDWRGFLGGNQVWQSLNDTANKTSKLVAWNQLSPGTMTFQVRYHDSVLGWSDWSAAKTCVVQQQAQATVNPPTIQSPTNGGLFAVSQDLTVTVDTFSVSGGSDTQASLTVGIYADNGGSVQKATKTVAGTGTSVTFSSADLSQIVDGETYYLIAYRTGTSLGQSGNSTPVSITATSAYVATPSIAGPSTGSEIIKTSQRGVALSTFEVIGGSDTPVQKEVKICTDSAGTNEVARQASSGTGWVYFDENDWGSFADGQYYAFGRWQGQTLGWSAWSEPVVWNIRGPYIRAPWIREPGYGDYIFKAGVTVEVYQFECEGDADTQDEMQVQIFDDTAGTTVHTFSQQSSSLTLNTGDLTIYNLDSTHSYKLRVRQRGVTYGWSDWSDVDVSYLPVSPVLEENSWAEISDIGSRGIAQNVWDIGDVKKVTLSGYLGYHVTNGVFDNHGPNPDNDKTTPGGGTGDGYGLKIVTFEINHHAGVYLQGFTVDYKTVINENGIRLDPLPIDIALVNGPDVSIGNFQDTITIGEYTVNRPAYCPAGGDPKEYDSSYARFLMNNRDPDPSSYTGSHNAGGWEACDARYWLLGSTDTAPSGYDTNQSDTTALPRDKSGSTPSSSALSSPVANSLMSCLPQELRAVMSEMYVYTDNMGDAVDYENMTDQHGQFMGSMSQSEQYEDILSHVTETKEYMIAPSEYELYGTISQSNPGEQEYQEQYEYYANGAVKWRAGYFATYWWYTSSDTWYPMRPEGSPGILPVLGSMSVAIMLRSPAVNPVWDSNDNCYKLGNKFVVSKTSAQAGHPQAISPVIRLAEEAS